MKKLVILWMGIAISAGTLQGAWADTTPSGQSEVRARMSQSIHHQGFQHKVKGQKHVGGKAVKGLHSKTTPGVKP